MEPRDAITICLLDALANLSDALEIADVWPEVDELKAMLISKDEENGPSIST
jgi:hypothetical protein